MNARLLLFFLVAGAQLAVPAWLIHREEATLAHGRLFKFKTAPVDPVDALRGRYVALSFDAASVPAEKAGKLAPPSGSMRAAVPVYATFAEDGEGYARVEGLSRDDDAPNDATLRVPLRRGWGATPWRIDLPFDAFYMEEGKAPRAEIAYRQHAKKDAYAVVAIYRGHAAIKDVYVGGVPIRDFLREIPPPAN